MEKTLPEKTASDFSNSSVGEPGSAHLHALTCPTVMRNQRNANTSARLATATIAVENPTLLCSTVLYRHNVLLCCRHLLNKLQRIQ